MKALRSLLHQQPEHVQVSLALGKEWRLVFDPVQDKHLPREEMILYVHLHNLGDTVVDVALVEVFINRRRASVKANSGHRLPPDGELSIPYTLPALHQGTQPHQPVARAVVHTWRRHTFKSPPLALPDTTSD